MTSDIREYNGLQYLIHFPEHYDEHKTYPIILYLHDAWSDTYANSELYAWLLQYENSNAVVLTDEYTDAKTYG